MNTPEIVNVPYPTSRDIRNLLPFNPGVVQDASGQVHVAGSQTWATLDTMDGFDIRSPVNGTLDMRVSADAVRSIDAETTRYPVEFGRATGGVLAFYTGMGDNKFRFNATNFIPSFRDLNGIRFDKFVPRFTFSGPLVRNRAWFFDGLETEYDNIYITELPANADTDQLVRGSNLMKIQANLTPSNILTGGLLFNDYHSPYDGISSLTPQQSTTKRDTIAWLPYLRDQWSFRGGALLDVGVGAARIRDGYEPHGDIPYRNHSGTSQRQLFREPDRPLAADGRNRGPVSASAALGRTPRPEGRHRCGPYRLRRKRHARAGQLSARGRNAVAPERFPADSALCPPQRRAGRLCRGSMAGADGTACRAGPALGLGRDRPASAPVAAHCRHLLAAGKQRRDQTVGRHRALLRAHATGIPDARAGGRPLRHILCGGRGDSAGPPQETDFSANDASLREARAINWSLGVEQKIPGSIFAGANFLQKRTSNGFAYVNESGPAALSGNYALTNARQDHYDSVEFDARRLFANGYALFASYTRSSARTNAALDYLPTPSPLGSATERASGLGCAQPRDFLGLAARAAAKAQEELGLCLHARLAYRLSVHLSRRKPAGGGSGGIATVSGLSQLQSGAGMAISLPRRILRIARRAGKCYRQPESRWSSTMWWIHPSTGAFSEFRGRAFTARIRLIGAK